MTKRQETENIEAQLLLYAENELDPAARAEVEALLAQHPEYRQMLAEYDPDFRLPVPETPAYPNKGALLHRTVLPLWVRRTASAAAVILLLCLAIPTAYRQLHRPGNETVAGNNTLQPATPAAQPQPADSVADSQPATTPPARKAAAATVMDATQAVPATSLLADAGEQPALPGTQPEEAGSEAHTGNAAKTAATLPADSATIVYVYTDNLVEYVHILSEEGAEREQQVPQSSKGKLLQWMGKMIRNNVPEELEEELAEKITAGTETVKRFYGKVAPVYNTLLSYLSNE
ncbi:MAG: hypothetical protein J6S82_02820 [Bacteroidales bacterium]|nr:hypothetical protein [Bacteroidales bacterium]